MEIKNLLAHEIADAVAALGSMEKGSTEYGNLVSDIVKLTGQYNEMECHDDDFAIKEETLKLEAEKLELERESAEKDRENARNNRLFDNCLTAVDIGTKVFLFVWACNTAWKWERTDTLTNTPGKEVNKAIFRLKLW